MSKAWMPLYVGDYLGDTTHLNQGQHGAYLLFIMHYWQRGSLPGDKQECYCIARAMDQQSRSNADKVLKQFFMLRGDIYKHVRIDAELAKAAESYEKRVSAANQRWRNAKHPPSSSNGHALHEQSESQSESQSKKNRGSAQPLPSQDDFDERDQRLLAAAKRTVLARIKANEGSQVTETEFMSAVCEESGLTPAKVKRLEGMLKWPAATA